MADPIRFRDDAAPDAVPLPLADFLSDDAATAVRLEPADEPRALLPHLARLALVEIAFPTFRDGRGYSSARILREGGYRGELRAVGDVLIDQAIDMRRCGFDALSGPTLDPVAVREALARFPAVYQPAADRRTPVWALRHG